jgi:transposase InsO family protein
VLVDEKATTAIGFLRRASASAAPTGSRWSRLMTDNGSAYCSIAHALAYTALGLRHIHARP